MQIDVQLRQRAERQHGFVSTEDLRTFGHDGSAVHRLVESGILIPERRGLYSLGHQSPSDARTRHRYVLAAGPGARLTGPAALEHLGIARSHSYLVDVVVPCRRRAIPGARLHVDPTITRTPRLTHDDIELAPVARALRDAARYWPVGEVARAVREALFRRLTTVLELRRVASVRAHGAPRLRAAIAELDRGGGGSDSRFEDRLRVFLESRHDMPRLVANRRIRIGARRFRIDLMIDGGALCIEADGPHHDLEHVQREDRRRDATLRAAGYVVYRIRQADFDIDPHSACAATIAAIGNQIGCGSTAAAFSGT